MNGIPNSLEAGIRALILEVAREEAKRVVAEALRPEEYLSTVTAAGVAEVSVGTIRRWVHAGKLTRHSAGREIRVRRAELEALLRSGYARPEQLSPEEAAMRDFA